MSKEIFLFIAAVFLLMPIVSLGEGLSMAEQLLFCAPFIFFIGIPHGAIDNILYQKRHPVSNRFFIGIYLLVIAVNVAIWVIVPQFAYILFLLISAYHFGQSQFTHALSTKSWVKQIIYISWGCGVLAALILFNLTELNILIEQYPEFSSFSIAHNKILLEWIFGSSTTLAFSMLLWQVKAKHFALESFLIESITLGLILLSFYLMPIIIGFSLYFVILHSVKVMREEFIFLKKEKLVRSWLSFIKVLSPFSIISFLGLGLFILLIHYDILTIPYGYALLIMISSITLPHVFVMERFYSVLYKK